MAQAECGEDRTPMISGSLVAGVWDERLAKGAREYRRFIDFFYEDEDHIPPTRIQRLRAGCSEARDRIRDAYRVLRHGDWIEEDI